MAEYQITAVLSLKDRMSAAIKSAAKAVSGLSKATDNIDKGVGSVAKGVKGISDQINIRANVDGLPAIERLKAATEAARQGSAKPIDIRARDEATSRLNKIRSELASLTAKPWQVAVNVKDNAKAAIANARGRISDSISNGAMAAGASFMGLGAAGGLTFGAVNAFKSQMDFESNMSSVKAVLSGAYQGDALNSVTESLTARAEELGASTKFTASEVAQGMRYAAMAGWKDEQIESGIKPILDLAAAGDADLATTSDIVTDAMTGFGLRAGEYVKNAQGNVVESSKHFADLMATLVTNANTDIPMLGETLKYVAPNIGALYANATSEERMLGAQDTMFIAGLMANSGIKSSQAGTSSRTLLTRMAAQNRNAYFGQEILGVKLSNENGEARRLKDVFGDFREKFRNGLDVNELIDAAEMVEGTKLHADTRRKLEGFIESAQKEGGKITGIEAQKLAAMIAGQEAMTGFLATIFADDETWNGLSDALDKAEGAAGRMADIRLDNLAGSFVYLGSAWDAFQRTLVKGDASQGLRNFVDSATEILSRANKLFADGIDIGDFGEIIVDVIARLKAKFLELDGIGSILAGGALMAGLKSILSMGLKVTDTLSAWTKVRTASDVSGLIRGKATGAVGGLQNTSNVNLNASTVNIRASVVNLSGNIRGQNTGGTVNNGGRVAINSGVNSSSRAADVSTNAARNASTRVSPIVNATNTSTRVSPIVTATRIPPMATLPPISSVAQIPPVTSTRMPSLAQGANIGTANIRAGVVNVSGQAMRGGNNSVSGGSNSFSGGVTANSNQSRVNDYYYRRQQILTGTSAAPSMATVPPAMSTVATPAATSRVAEGMKLSAGVGVMAAVFGAMDVMATRSTGAYNLDVAKEQVAVARNDLKILREQNAGVDQINAQVAKISQAEANVKQVAETNAINERKAGAGATGMIVGSVAGAAIGSAIPFVGNMVGGMIGGALGQMFGEWAAEHFPSINKTGEQDETDPVLKKYAAGINKHQRDNRGYEALSTTDGTESENTELALKNYAAGINRHQRDNRGYEALSADERIAARAESRRRRLERSTYTENIDAIDVQIAKNAKDRHNDALYRQKSESYMDSGRRVTKDEAMGHTSLANYGQTEGWVDARGTGNIKPFDEYSPEVVKKREEFRLGIAKNQETLSAIDSNYRFGRENYGDKYAKAVEENIASMDEFTYSPFKSAKGFKRKKPSMADLHKAEEEASAAPDVPKVEASVYRAVSEIDGRQGFTTATLTSSKAATSIAASTESAVSATESALAELKTSEASTVSELATLKATAGTPQIGTPIITASEVKSKRAETSSLSTAETSGSATESASAVESALEKIGGNIFDSTIGMYIDPLGAIFGFNRASASTRTESNSTAATEEITGVNQLEIPDINISEKLGAEFANVSSLAESFWSDFKTSAVASIEEFSDSLSGVTEGLSEFGASISEKLESVRTLASTFISEVTGTFSEGFEVVQSLAFSAFEGVSAMISSSVESARAGITNAFSSAAVEVQGVWSAVSGFFSGVFGGLGGIAMAAGSSIAAGINSGIGMIQGAWEALSGWLSAKISALSSMAANAAASIGIGSNYAGTSNWRGGFTTVNEHGGELIILPNGETITPFNTASSLIRGEVASNYSGMSFFRGGWSEVNGVGSELMYLPTGTRIIPHATTVNLLRREIHRKLGDKEVNSALGDFRNISGIDIPAYNFINAGDSISVKRAKHEAQIQQYWSNLSKSKFYSNAAETATESAISRYNSATGDISGINSLNGDVYDSSGNFNARKAGNFKHYVGIDIANNYGGTSRFGGGFSEVNEHGGEMIILPGGATIYPRATTQNIINRALETDRLGNIRGVDIPDHNRITDDDSLIVRRAKYRAQLRQLNLLRRAEHETRTALSGAESSSRRILLHAAEASRRSSWDVSQSRRAEETSGALAPSIENSAAVSAGANLSTRSERRIGFSKLLTLLEESVARPFRLETAPDVSVQGSTPSLTSSSIFGGLDKTVKRVSNFFFKIFHPRKYAASKSESVIAQTASSSTGIDSASKANVWNRIRNRIGGRRRNVITEIGDKIFGGTNIETFDPTTLILHAANSDRRAVANISTNTAKSIRDDTFGNLEIGSLPVPDFNSADKIAGTITNTDNSTSTNASTRNSSSASFNFGDVNITNGMDFEEFMHQLKTLITQGASNFAG